MAKLEVTLVRSLIGRPEKQRKIIEALGLHHIGSKVVHDDFPNIRVMIKKVVHLVTWQERKE